VIHDLGVFVLGVVVGVIALATLLYARWVSAALDRTEP